MKPSRVRKSLVKPLAQLGQPQVGKARVVFMNYAADESPLKIAPKIILIRPNDTSEKEFNVGMFWENFGLLTLATHLETCGIKFGVLDASLFQCSLTKTVNLAIKYSPKFIGVSVFSTDILKNCITIAEKIKRKNKDIYTILGGHGASFPHKYILEDNDEVDIVIRGEAEKSLAQLLCCKEIALWQEISNLSYRHKGTIYTNPMEPVERDLDRLPLPHRFVQDIISQDPILSKAPLMSISSRGCFDKCKFCSVASSYSSMWRGRSAKHVVDEVEFLVKKYNRRNIYFWDDLFIGPGPRGHRRAIEIAKEILNRKLDITFQIITRPTGLDEEMVKILVKAGLRSVFLGIENANQNTLDYFGKHTKAEDGKKAVDLLWNNGVYRILTGYIIFHPRMTWSEYRRSVDYLDSFPTMEISRTYSCLAYCPGTEFWLEDEKDLPPDAYKRSIDARLPNEDFKRLNDVCYWFYENTLEIERIIVCLEEQYLRDDEIIKFLAACKLRLFRFMTERSRVIADHLEHGRDDYEDASQFGDDIMVETLNIIDDIKKKINDEYLDLLLKVFQIEDYKKWSQSNLGYTKKAIISA